MKTAKELYPRFDYCECDYSPMLDSFGTIVLQVDDEHYQGDSRVLYQDGERIGYLQFGWGSCSGCDSLQACNSYSMIDALIDELRTDIKWFDTKAAALSWFKSHDWEGDYSSHSEEQKQFVSEAIKWLEQP